MSLDGCMYCGKRVIFYGTRICRACRDAAGARIEAERTERVRIVEAGKEALDRFNEPRYNDPAINPYMADLLAYCRLLEAEAEASE